MKIGIITDCMKRNTLAEALADAARLGADGVQIYATTGEFTPDTLGAEAKAKYKAFFRSMAWRFPRSAGTWAVTASSGRRTTLCA